MVGAQAPDNSPRQILKKNFDKAGIEPGTSWSRADSANTRPSLHPDIKSSNVLNRTFRMAPKSKKIGSMPRNEKNYRDRKKRTRRQQKNLSEASRPLFPAFLSASSFALSVSRWKSVCVRDSVSVCACVWVRDRESVSACVRDRDENRMERKRWAK